MLLQYLFLQKCKLEKPAAMQNKIGQLYRAPRCLNTHFQEVGECYCYLFEDNSKLNVMITRNMNP